LATRFPENAPINRRHIPTIDNKISGKRGIANITQNPLS